MSQCLHVFIRVPTCLRKQDMPKSHLKFESLVHEQKNKASGFALFIAANAKKSLKLIATSIKWNKK